MPPIMVEFVGTLIAHKSGRLNGASYIIGKLSEFRVIDNFHIIIIVSILSASFRISIL